MAFYDKPVTCGDAVLTEHACKGAVLIRDLLKSMITFVTEFKNVVQSLETKTEHLKMTKKEFDSHWLKEHRENLELWPMDKIIRRFQVVLMH